MPSEARQPLLSNHKSVTFTFIAERSLALACDRESAANLRAQNLEDLLEFSKQEAATAAADKKALQQQMDEMMVQARLKEVKMRQLACFGAARV